MSRFTDADLQGQGQQTVFAPFHSPEQDLIPGPGDVALAEGSNLTPTHTVGTKQGQDVIIATAHDGGTIHRLKHALCPCLGALPKYERRKAKYRNQLAELVAPRITLQARSRGHGLYLAFGRALWPAQYPG